MKGAEHARLPPEHRTACSPDAVTAVRRLRVAACALAITYTASCDPRRDPVYVSPDLQEAVISSIAIAPIADARADPFEDVQIVRYVRRTIENVLNEKGYTVAQTGLSRAGANVTANDVAKMTDAELAEAAPVDVSHVMAVSLDRVTTPAQDVGETTRVKLSGRLVDVGRGLAVWRDTAEGEADLGGLLTMLTGPSTDYEGVYDAARLLVSTLPDNPGRARSPAVERGEHSRAPLHGMRPSQER